MSSPPSYKDGFAIELREYSVFLLLADAPAPIPLYTRNDFADPAHAVPLRVFLKEIQPDLCADLVTNRILHTAELRYRKAQYLRSQPHTAQERRTRDIAVYAASVVWHDAQNKDWYVTWTERWKAHKKTA